MYKIIEFNNEEVYINDFINLSHKLYSKKEFMQNDLELRQLLLNKHIFSKYFNIKKFLVYKDNIAVSRVALIFYENDNNVYFGFFETENNLEAVKILFKKINEEAKQNNKEKIIGPVNASFWIGYRLKINNFNDLPYIGEPYNKDYYYNLLKQVNFLDYEKYYTNFYNKPHKKYMNSKTNKRYNYFKEKNYEIKTLADFKNKEDTCYILYDLIIDLYKNFPIFKWISKEDYYNYTKNNYKICNYKMQKLYYYNNKPVAFCVTFPNYNNLLLQNTNISKLQILKRKFKSKQYVILYMGVKKQHSGLGLAMINEVIKDIKSKKAYLIGALIKSGKVTAKYINEEIIKQNEYVLLYKEYNKKEDI